MNFHLVIEIALKLFFMLTPFFVLSMFFTLTSSMNKQTRMAIARRAMFGITVVCLILYFFGQQIFLIFGITVDSFRIGAGIILMLTAIEQVRGMSHDGVKRIDQAENAVEIAIVPLTIPYVVGPGTIGMLLVQGGIPCSFSDRLSTAVGITIASVSVGMMICCADALQRFLSHRILQILSKITGLVLAALAAQSIMEGIMNFLKK